MVVEVRVEKLLAVDSSSVSLACVQAGALCYLAETDWFGWMLQQCGMLSAQ